MPSTITINPPTSSSFPASSKSFIFSRRGLRAMTIILIMLNLIFKIRKLWDIKSFINDYEYTSEQMSLVPFPPPHSLHDSQDLIRLIANDGGSYLETLSEGGPKMGWTKQDYCHPITSSTKIVNNSYHDDIIDFNGNPTSYPLWEMFHFRNLKPMSEKFKQKQMKKQQKQKRKQQQQQRKHQQALSSDALSSPSPFTTTTTHAGDGYRRRRGHTTRAICHFRGVRPYWYEMPHAMQQLYPCLSFWMSQVDEYKKRHNNTHYYLATEDDGEEDKVAMADKKMEDYERDDEDLTLILIWDPKAEPVEMLDLRFVYGMLEIFRNVFHVKLFNSTDHMHLEYENYYRNYRSDRERKKAITDIYVHTKFSVLVQEGQASGYKMQNSHHAELMRKMTAEYYPHIFTSTSAASAPAATAADISDEVASNKTMMITAAAAGCPVEKEYYENNDDDPHQNHHPVIGILNRAPGPLMGRRTIDNVNLLQEALQAEFSSSSSSMAGGRSAKATATATIRPIQYFENATVWEQLAWFHNVDIVISPHGAQLTGLPFVPKCGGLLEYFPKNYYLPYYFGSLASVSGLQYIHMYLGQNLTSEWYEGAKDDEEWQADARTNTSLCVPIPETIEAVRILINNWHSCCSE